MSNASIYYFLIANHLTQKEIGTFIDSYDTGNSINDFNTIVNKAKEILHNSDTSINKSKKNKLVLDTHVIYYIVTNLNTFYLAAVRKNSIYCQQENLIFELIEDIDHQGIKKLVDKNGELTNVGRQNLKFSIEKYQETNRSKFTSNSSTSGNSSSNSNINSIFASSREMSHIDVNDDNKNNQSKISNLNTQINSITTDMKDNVKNMISNVNEMQDLDNKSAQIKDSSIQFKKGAIDLERKARLQKYKMKIIMASVVIVVILFILYLIFK